MFDRSSKYCVNIGIIHIYMALIILYIHTVYTCVKFMKPNFKFHFTFHLLFIGWDLIRGFIVVTYYIFLWILCQ